MEDILQPSILTKFLDPYILLNTFHQYMYMVSIIFRFDKEELSGTSCWFSDYILPAFMEMVSDQVLLLCSDSTYAENDGYTPSDRIVGETLDRVIGESEGRVLIATFASLISRVQQIIDAAVKHHRKVAVIGRSMISNVKMATKMGYLNVPDGTIITLTLANDLPANEVVIIATGAQGAVSYTHLTLPTKA